MKRLVLVSFLAGLVLAGCKVVTPTPPVHPPAPAPSPAPTPKPSVRVTIWLTDAVTRKPISNAEVWVDMAGGPSGQTNADGFLAFQDVAPYVVTLVADGPSLPLHFRRDGYRESTTAYTLPLNRDLHLTMEPLEVGPQWTKEQLRDLQGDLMIWAPEVGCRSAETKIRCDARGLQAGWVWSLTLPRYSAGDRAQLYKDIKAFGWTHVAIQVARCEVGDGYHNLLPEDCVDYDLKLNTVLKELWAQHLIPVCAGVSPDVPVSPGLDRTLCPVVMDDWDNDHKKDCRVKMLAQTFPKALVFVEMPQGVNPQGRWQPSPDACSPSPFPSGGGEWIRNLQRQFPNFIGVLYEVNQPDGLDANVSDLSNWNPWFRDLQQVVFETDTYWKFWEALPFAAAQQYNDALRARAPQTRGYFSGGTSHPAPAADVHQDGSFDGELDASTVQTVEGPDWRSWPQTTTLSKVELGLDDMHLTFDAQDRWPDVSFGVQYSIGVCERVQEAWYCDAPIELWKGKPGGGGQIQNDSVLNPDFGGVGQLAAAWFYNDRWKQLARRQPAVGEQIGVFVVAGDARNAVNDVRERSNIVLIRMPPRGVVAVFGR